jgi:hypothetical protein
MAPRQKVPSKDVLRRWRDEGLTQQEMVHRVLAESGEEVSRSAIANAMTRYGLAEDGARYPQEVPWSVNAMHATANPLRMLRLLGRRQSGIELNNREGDMLDRWLSQLDEKDLIVAYDHNDIRGFHYISAIYKDHTGDSPVRIKQLRMSARRRSPRQVDKGK